MKGKKQSIPAFGDWEKLNQLPLTQYFDSARQAGLVVRRTSSSDNPPHSQLSYPNSKPPSAALLTQGKGRSEKKGRIKVEEGSRKEVGGGKVFDVKLTDIPPPPSVAANKRQPFVLTPNKQQPRQLQCIAEIRVHHPPPPPKPVDEDLYKIPPELLKRKRRLGFISRCLVPPCAV